MADDMNKSNKPMNGFGMSDLERIGSAAHTIPKAEEELRLLAERKQYLREIPKEVISKSPTMTRLEKRGGSIGDVQQRIRISMESRLERSNMQVMNAQSNAYSEPSINGQVKSLMSMPDNQNRSLTMMGSSYEELEGRRDTINGQIKQLGLQSMSVGQSYFTNRGVNSGVHNQLAANAMNAGKMTNEMASIDLAMKSMRANGMDPYSKFNSINDSGRSASSLLSGMALRDEVNSGGVNISRDGQQVKIGNKDIGSATISEATTLNQKLKELSESAGKSTEELDKLRKEAEESASNFEKLKSASSGGGSGGSNIDKFNFAGSAFGAAANAMQQIGVNQSLASKYNAAGLAGIENQKYTMFQKASAGDVQSQMLLSKWSGAEGFGSNIKAAANTAVGLQVAGGAAQTTVAGIKLAEAGVQKFNPFSHFAGTATNNSSAAYESAGQMAQGLSNTAIGAADLGRGISGNQAKIAGINAQMELEKQISAVPAAQLQGFRDFSTGMGTVARGMGAGGGAFLRGLQGDDAETRLMKSRSGAAVNEGVLPRMAQEGISPEQMVQMAQLGQSSMGSMFDKEQIFQARGLEKSGFGTMAENQQRQAMLASAGSNNPQAGLSSVLEAAFGKSLDNAKSLTALVENTGAMASKSGVAAMGMDATAASATMLAAGIDPNQSNREFAVQRARNAAERGNDIVTDESTNFANQSAMARVSSIKGMSGVGAVAANKLGVVDLKTIQEQAEKNPEEAARALRKLGVNANTAGVKDEVGSLLENAQLKMLEKGGIPVGANVRGMLKNINKGGKLTEQEELMMGQVSALGGFAGGADNMLGAIRGVTAKNDPNAIASIKSAEAGTAGSKEIKDADKLLTSGFSQLATAADAAAKQLGGAAKAMEKLIALQDETNKHGGVQNETKAGIAAKNASEANMLDDAGKVFSSATNDFKTSVDLLLKGLGGKSQTTNSANDTKGGKSPGQH